MLARSIIKPIVWCTNLTNLKRTNNYTRKDSSRLRTTHFSYSRGVFLQTPTRQRPPRHRPPWTETPPWREIPLDRDHPEWTETPQKEHGLGTEVPLAGTRDQATRQEVTLCRDPCGQTNICKNITLRQTTFEGSKNGSVVRVLDWQPADP